MLHECPHCHEKTITTWNKAIAGTFTSKGTKCPKCGSNCVNDVKSTYFRSVINVVILAYSCAVVFEQIGGYLFRFGSIIGLILLSRVLIICFDAFFPKLTNSIHK